MSGSSASIEKITGANKSNPTGGNIKGTLSAATTGSGTSLAGTLDGSLGKSTVHIRFACSPNGGGLYRGETFSGISRTLTFSVTHDGMHAHDFRLLIDGVQNVIDHHAATGLALWDEHGFGYGATDQRADVDGSGHFSVHIPMQSVRVDGTFVSGGTATVTGTIDRKSGATGDVTIAGEGGLESTHGSWKGGYGNIEETISQPVIVAPPVGVADINALPEATLTYPGFTPVSGEPLVTTTPGTPSISVGGDKPEYYGMDAEVVRHTQTTDSLDQIVTWFGQQLTSKGWQLASGPVNGYSERLNTRWRKGSDEWFTVAFGVMYDTGVDAGPSPPGITIVNTAFDKGPQGELGLDLPAGPLVPRPICEIPHGGASITLTGSVSGTATTTCASYTGGYPPRTASSCAPPFRVHFFVDGVAVIIDARLHEGTTTDVSLNWNKGDKSFVSWLPGGSVQISPQNGTLHVQAVLVAQVAGDNSSAQLDATLPCSSLMEL